MRCCFFAVFIGLASPVLALNPALPPGKNFDLSHWHLTLPDANASTITPSSLTNGYTNDAWFYTGMDGAMVFYCPVNGGTTSNSQYPRTELRERISPSSTAVNWTYRGTHILEAECRVLQAPSNGELWFGQNHGYLSNAPALFLLHYSNGMVRAQFRTNPVVAGTIFLPLTNVALNQSITYRIEFSEGLLTASVNGATQRIAVLQWEPGWTNQNFYFKAGSYCRDNEGPATEGARVSFYHLQAAHLPSAVAPVVTLQPSGLATNPGVTVTLSSFALGTPPLFFQWFKDGGLLPTRTNSQLVISNTAPTHAGFYHCLITNSFGAEATTAAGLSLLPVPSPVLSLRMASGQARLEWTAVPGRTYRVHARSELGEGAWTELAPPVLIQGSLASFEEDSVSSNRFYRVVTD